MKSVCSFNFGENPYTSEYKKVRQTIKERKKKIAIIKIFNSELSSTF